MVVAGVVASQAASFATNMIYAAAQNAKLEVTKPTINNYLGKYFQLAVQLKTQDISHTLEMVKANVDSDFKNILGLMEDGNLLSAGGMFATLYDAWSGSSQLLNTLNSSIQEIGIKPFTDRYINYFVNPNIPDPELAWYMKELGVFTQSQKLVAYYQNGWGLDYPWRLDQSFRRPVPIDMIIKLFQRGWITNDSAKTLLKWHRINEDFADYVLDTAINIPEPYRAADFAAKHLIGDSAMNEAFQWVGLSPQWASVWKASQQTIPDFNMGMSLFWRHAITMDTFKSWLKRAAWDDVIINDAMALTERIPPSNDLVTMVVREAWEPSNVTPAPEVFARYMDYSGFNKDWSDRYWTAHWLPMGIQYGYANLHRGFWTKEQFTELLRIADIHPRWRDAIYNVAFNPPSIREMGYGYDVGAYTKEDIIKYRRWGGLSEADANKAGLAMVAYRTEAERESVRREYLNLYVLGKIEDDEFTEELTAIGTAPEAVPLWLERGQLRKSAMAWESSTLEPKAMTRSDAQWLFEHGVKDETWLRQTLLGLSYTADDTEEYILQSKQRMNEKGTPDEPKTLTLAQLRTLYSIGKLNDEQYISRIIALGYNAADAQSILDITKKTLEVVPAPVKYNEISLSQLSNLYYYGFIRRSEFISRLVTNGYSPEDAELLVTYYLFEMMLSDMKKLYSNGWITKNDMRDELVDSGIDEYVAYGILQLIVKAEQPARVATEKDLTKAEIVKGAKNNVISVTSAVSLLQGIGYDEDEAWYILAINKVVAAGDPEGYWEMRSVVESYRKAQGQQYTTIPQELITLEAEQRKIKAELENAKLKHESEAKIGEIAVALANVNSRMNTIIAKLGIS